MSASHKFKAKLEAAQTAYEMANDYMSGNAIGLAADALERSAGLLRQAAMMRMEANGLPTNATVAEYIRVPAALIPLLEEFFGRTLGMMHADGSFDAQAVLNRDSCIYAVQRLSGAALTEGPARG
ncbi:MULTISPECIES: hypothetical protein [Hyphomonas]|uniref:Uncharacterized protein n=1 Tax=Hyphomonas adhaerens TaxID=81029 RepID=A0A3B9H006_9PROT|nr:MULTISPECIES: hypothetical protein [Hyphomonas]MBB40995.1 hypothetical protein [Hyphomonas sp.]HAE28000.1 hypothetical protein [Hyphomonas adhaerens]|tara:strand:- start:250 stop:624 length:375 start_codon:yes stop_codon:yes gene_type:complete